MENRGLLFIPDISGFTRFVTQTEIEHSRIIIQELLDILINANSTGLQVSEIEGDAILFYKFGEPPSLEKIYNQVEQMFCAFHKNISSYDQRRYCQCAACSKAIDLTLKVITHYGEFTGYNVQQFHKLIGKDVIVAHQLLKNDINEHEYWLVTNNLLTGEGPLGITDWMQWNSSIKKTEEGEVPFYFTQLSPLRQNIFPDPVTPPRLNEKRKIFSLSGTYNADLILLFHACGDFNNRSEWMEGVTKMEEVGHYLPRVGMRSRVVNEKGKAMIYSSSYHYDNDHIEFSETNESNGYVMYFTLETTGINKTALVLDYYVPKTPAGLLFGLTGAKTVRQRLGRSLQNLEDFLKTNKIK
jgi:hypothetical protein